MVWVSVLPVFECVNDHLIGELARFWDILVCVRWAYGVFAQSRIARLVQLHVLHVHQLFLPATYAAPADAVHSAGPAGIVWPPSKRAMSRELRVKC